MGEAKNRRDAQGVVDRNKALQAHADPLAAELIDAMKGQLLMVLINRRGGEVRVPVAEIDDTGGLLLSMRLDGSTFVFQVEKKQ